ncbi:NAC domain-containing protein [Hirschfeldia incana]|nr:NAC domain-containing protein [Hirschfeldia incana]
METIKVGFRFCPTDEELINYFLKNKIQGKPWLVDDTIREVSICSCEPASLPALSMIKSKDHVWYFLSPKEYKSPKKSQTKRTTPSGFWKSTGKDRKVRGDKRRNGVVIGNKKTLVYHEGKSSNAVPTPWVMHEYHITSLPPADQSYVICKIFYKGNVRDIPSGSNSKEASQYLVLNDSNSVGATNTPPQVEQAGQENLSGFSMNGVTMLMNEQEDLCAWDALCPIPNTLFIDNNDNTNVQLQAPCLAQDNDEDLGVLTHIESLFTDHQEFLMQENSEENMINGLAYYSRDILCGL